MARNIEIKARVDDLDLLETAVKGIADQGPTSIHQDDTFFHCDQGRLKLRVLGHHSGELIFYQRPDQAGPKECVYQRSLTRHPASLLETLTLAYGQIGCVKKQRTLYLIGQTRVHLDRVEALGDFMELEVVLKDGQTSAEGVAIAEALMEQLRIDHAHLIEGAYIDLLQTQRKHS